MAAVLGDANTVATIFASVVGVVLTGAGLYFAYNHRRQVQLQITDRRLDAYAGLWELMQPASPMRRPETGFFNSKERLRLFDEMTDWYYKDGHGMLLQSLTREMYLVAKRNLVCDDDALTPKSLRKGRELTDEERGALSGRQLSLLRSQMKKDVEIYGLPFHDDLDEADKAFLMLCGADLGQPPWSTPWYQLNRPRSRREA